MLRGSRVNQLRHLIIVRSYDLPLTSNVRVLTRFQFLGPNNSAGLNRELCSRKQISKNRPCLCRIFKDEWAFVKNKRTVKSDKITVTQGQFYTKDNKEYVQLISTWDNDRQTMKGKLRTWVKKITDRYLSTLLRRYTIKIFKSCRYENQHQF